MGFVVKVISGETGQVRTGYPVQNEAQANEMRKELRERFRKVPAWSSDSIRVERA